MNGTGPNYVVSGTAFCNYRRANGLLVRGYVTKVYAADDTTAKNSPAANGEPEQIGSILCDVMVIEPGYRALLTNVPVLSTAGGLDSVAVWTPQEVSKLAATGIPTLGLSDSGHLLTTDPSKTDGDLVVVGFLGDDVTRPVIVGSLLKPNSNHAVTKANLGTYAWAHHAVGSVMGVEAGGRVVIDTTAQPTALAADEIVIRTGGTGGVDGSTVTVSGGNVTIDCGSLGQTEITGNALSALHPTQEVMLENALRDLTALVSAIATFTGAASNPTVAALLATLTAGIDATGAPYTSKSMKAD